MTTNPSPERLRVLVAGGGVAGWAIADEELAHLAWEGKAFHFAEKALMMEVDYRLRRDIDPHDSHIYFQRKRERLQAAGGDPVGDA